MLKYPCGWSVVNVGKTRRQLKNVDPRAQKCRKEELLLSPVVKHCLNKQHTISSLDFLRQKVNCRGEMAIWIYCFWKEHDLG